MRPSYSQLLEWVKPEPPLPKDLECMKSLNPGDYEIYTDRLYNYVLEGTEVFIRTGTSEWIRSGDLIVGIETLPIILGEKRTLLLLRCMALSAALVLVAALVFGLVGPFAYLLLLTCLSLTLCILAYERRWLYPGRGEN